MRKYSPVGGLLTEAWLRKLAMLMHERVCASGGDGGGTIVCRYHDHLEIAAKLESFFTKETHFNTKDVDKDGRYVTFTNHQEGITILRYDPDEKTPHPFDDITVII